MHRANGNLLSYWGKDGLFGARSDFKTGLKLVYSEKKT